MDVFGYAVDISHNNLIVGAFQHDYNVVHADSINEAGAAYIFSACGAPIAYTQDTSICFGTSITVGTSTYSTNGNYTDALSTSQGCDSIVTTNLTILPQIITNQNITICNTGSYSIGTSTYNSTGTYTDILTSVISGCDSTVNTTIAFYPDNGITQTITICDGDSYSIGSSTYNAEGSYSDVFTSVLNGCDSTVIIDLFFNTASVASKSLHSDDMIGENIIKW